MAKDKRTWADRHEELPVWMLDYKDKALHRNMAHTRTMMRKVVSGLRAAPTTYERCKHAEEMEGAAAILDGWMQGVRHEAWLRKQGKGGGGNGK